ncbi:Uncharacterised protein [Pseudomonas aeruginosa]|nr:Uncharacterised protein [Pseudomonas aeruginosa]
MFEHRRRRFDLRIMADAIEQHASRHRRPVAGSARPCAPRRSGRRLRRSPATAPRRAATPPPSAHAARGGRRCSGSGDASPAAPGCFRSGSRRHPARSRRAGCAGPKTLAKLRARARRSNSRPNSPPNGLSNSFWLSTGRCVSGNSPPLRNTQEASRSRPSVMAGEQFLGDAVAVVVGQHVQRLVDSQAAEQPLLAGRPAPAGCSGWARGLAESPKPSRSQTSTAVALRQRLPEVVPVPGGAGKTVDQQQRPTLPGFPVADREALEIQSAAAPPPGLQGNAGQRRGHWR